MDIVHYLNQAQVVEEMHEILFNKSDRMLMQVQKRQVIQSSESSSDKSTASRLAADDFTSTHLRKVFLVKNEESRQKFRQALRDLLSLYQDRHTTPKERRVLYGIT